MEIRRFLSLGDAVGACFCQAENCTRFILGRGLEDVLQKRGGPVAAELRVMDVVWCAVYFVSTIIYIYTHIGHIYIYIVYIYYYIYIYIHNVTICIISALTHTHTYYNAKTCIYIYTCTHTQCRHDTSCTQTTWFSHRFVVVKPARSKSLVQLLQASSKDWEAHGLADTDSYIITKNMGNLFSIFMASNVIMAISNQTYLRVYPLTQDSVIPPVAILTGTTMFGPWNFGATIFGQNLSSCTISNTDWRLYPHWMGFYINGKIIEVKWTKWWFSSKPCLINRGYLCNPLPKSAPPLKPHRILLVTRKLETGQERSGNTMKHLHQMNELMGRFCTHTHTQSLIAQTLWLKDNFLKSEGQHEILSKHVKAVTFLASKFEHQKSGEWVRGIFEWTLQHNIYIPAYAFIAAIWRNPTRRKITVQVLERLLWEDALLALARAS